MSHVFVVNEPVCSASGKPSRRCTCGCRNGRRFDPADVAAALQVTKSGLTDNEAADVLDLSSMPYRKRPVSNADVRLAIEIAKRWGAGE